VQLRREAGVVFLPPNDVSVIAHKIIFFTNNIYFQQIWRGDIRIKRFINLDNRDYIRAVRYHNRYEIDELWHDTPEGREIANIYNIEDIFNLRILFGIDPYIEEPAPERWD